MSRFSGVLQLTDLDDFITPSQVSKWMIKIILIYNFYIFANFCIFIEGMH